MKTILINKEAWQTRVAILSDGRLQDLFFDTSGREDLERCFFKGKVTKVLRGIQTAFVDIDQHKAGFLHVSEVDRALASEKILEYFQESDETKEKLSPREIKSSMDISKIFTEQEDTLVQVIKEPIYEKGAKLTTCFTLPGKFVVLMPNIPQIGVSKKIADREERSRLKELIGGILPKEMGAIARTTAEGRPFSALKKDIELLVETWKEIQARFKQAKSGEKVYQDLPIALRVMRDHLDDDVDKVIVDDETDLKDICSFVKNLTPEFVKTVQLYKGARSLFERYDVDQQIEKALQKKVLLKSGGSIIIEATEAMSVVDVNTGKFVGGSGSMEETILKTNLEAAEEVVIQLRLRNIGGLIVIDFIDMASSANRQKLSNFLEKTLKQRDRFQSVALKVSEFGIVQMTRKRSGKTLVQQLTNTCQACKGGGQVKSVAMSALEILRNFKAEMKRKRKKVGPISLIVSPQVFDYLIHNVYKGILQLEKDLSCTITLESSNDLEGNRFTIQKSE